MMTKQEVLSNLATAIAGIRQLPDAVMFQRNGLGGLSIVDDDAWAVYVDAFSGDVDFHEAKLPAEQ